MTLSKLKELFSNVCGEDISITLKRVAIFDTIIVILTDTDKLILTYNEKTDQLKVQLGTLTELFPLINLEPWFLRQRLLSLALETHVNIHTIEEITKTWEEY